MSQRVLGGFALVAAAAMVLAGCSQVEDLIFPPPNQPETPLDPGVAPPLGLDELEAFSGVVTLNAGSNCTGTLIDTGVATGPAYVLTNGHCIGDVGRPPQRTTLGLEWFGEAEFLRAEGNLDNTYTVPVEQIAYSTMRLTDLGIVRLGATLGDLQARGIKAIPVADSEPAPGDSVVNVGVPVQGLLHEDWVMRKGECTLAEQNTVIEFGWLWENVWANDCPGIIQGSSGSPLLSTNPDGSPNHIVGVINTTSWGATAANGGLCFINRPCQVTADAVTMVEETSYAQSAAGIGACFDQTTGEFSVGGECPLPVSNIWAEHSGGSFQGGDVPDSNGRVPTVSFVGDDVGTFRTALVPIGDATACTDPATYDGAQAQPLLKTGEDWEQVGTVFGVDLPTTEGWYTQCAVRGDDYAQAATVLFEVDRTPPLFAADADVDVRAEGASVVPHLNPPEISTVRFGWGPEGSTDCADESIYQDFLTVPPWIEASELPVTFCIYGMDAAGNVTPKVEIPVPAP